MQFVPSTGAVLNSTPSVQVNAQGAGEAMNIALLTEQTDVLLCANFFKACHRVPGRVKSRGHDATSVPCLVSWYQAPGVHNSSIGLNGTCCLTCCLGYHVRAKLHDHPPRVVPSDAHVEEYLRMHHASQTFAWLNLPCLSALCATPHRKTASSKLRYHGDTEQSVDCVL